MANGPLGLNTRLLLPPHRSSTQHTRTRRCSTWNCSETKTHAPSLFCTLAERSEGPAPSSTALRLGFMNDSLPAGQCRAQTPAARGEKIDSKRQPPTHALTSNTNPISFQRKGKERWWWVETVPPQLGKGWQKLSCALRFRHRSGAALGRQIP